MGPLAGEDWHFAHVSQYFAKTEAGPLVISPQRSPRSSTAAWLKAVRECGYDVENPECDAPEAGCQQSPAQRSGARWSTADAYLNPLCAGQSDSADGGHGHKGAVRGQTRGKN